MVFVVCIVQYLYTNHRKRCANLELFVLLSSHLHLHTTHFYTQQIFVS